MWWPSEFLYIWHLCPLKVSALSRHPHVLFTSSKTSTMRLNVAPYLHCQLKIVDAINNVGQLVWSLASVFGLCSLIGFAFLVWLPGTVTDLTVLWTNLQVLKLELVLCFKEFLLNQPSGNWVFFWIRGLVWSRKKEENWTNPLVKLWKELKHNTLRVPWKTCIIKPVFHKLVILKTADRLRIKVPLSEEQGSSPLRMAAMMPFGVKSRPPTQLPSSPSFTSISRFSAAGTGHNGRQQGHVSHVTSKTNYS